MPTPKQLYARKIAEISKRYLSMEKDTIREMIAFMRQLRAQIADDLASATGFDAFTLQQLQQSVGRLVSQMEGQLAGMLRRQIDQSYTLGAQSVVDPVRELGYEGVFMHLNRAQVLTLQDFSADLIRNIGADTLAKINSQIRLSALGQQSPFEAMKMVSNILGVQDEDALKGVAYRSERIIRTELQRVFNISTDAQQQATAQQIPGLLKRWVATGDSRTRDTHLNAHLRYKDNPIPVDEAYQVGSVKMMYPLDPSAPARETIGCRCRSATIIPEIGVVGSPLDARIAKEKQRRQQEAWVYA